MTTVWVAVHDRPFVEGLVFPGERRSLGFFLTESEARAAVDAARILPGFSQHPDLFRVEEMSVDVDEEGWSSDGFSLARDAREVRAHQTGQLATMGPLVGDLQWYSVRTVYRLNEDTFEERVTIWRSRSFAEAIELAEGEAAEYTDGVSATYLGLAQAHRPFLEDAPLEPGAEIFSLLRESSLGDEEYLDHFFDSGDEYQGTTSDAP